ncbi:hypothetical protein GXW83_33065 [Streptacidiphilus sp. PB12-B1b]|uniref:hypothetical protein n=1 Tax=Streptacidiphilus sp. PB12-B1b TaxID=2705012 RepID=UPI0015FC59CE|nr:hypothetical protein [Streptacidiphilus sp. PB12-B1b]QMU79814.1 hypothetical protein GXW83_33065 [Streptacidiphilus sp. PB12-B1b]
MALLNWRDSSHWSDAPAPCVLCDKPTNLRSDRGKPVHKVCAEDWTSTHPTTATATPGRRNRR